MIHLSTPELTLDVKMQESLKFNDFLVFNIWNRGLVLLIYHWIPVRLKF